MSLQAFFEAVGGNLAEVMERLPNEALILRFLKMYSQDTSYGDLVKAFNEGNVKNAFLAAHTLKGVAANLGLGELQKAASALTESVRNSDHFGDPMLFEEVKVAQNKVIEQLSSLDN